MRPAELTGYDWLILTSANTVRALSARVAKLGMALMHSPGLQVAASEKRRRSSARAGFEVSLVPETYVAESLVEGTSRGPGEKFCCSGGSCAGLIPEALRAAAQRSIRGRVPECLAGICAGVATRALAEESTLSPSQFVECDSSQRSARLGDCVAFVGVPAISIGPITSKTLRDLGWRQLPRLRLPISRAD